MIVTEPLQLKNEVDGTPSGRYRMCEYSDEDENVFSELCDCENGHATPEEAKACYKESVAEEEADQSLTELMNKLGFTPDQFIHAMLDIECEKHGLDPDGFVLCLKLEAVKMMKGGKKPSIHLK